MLAVVACSNANSPSPSATASQSAASATPTVTPSLTDSPSPSPSPSPTVTPTPSPTPLPTPTPTPAITESQLTAACKGKAVPQTAKYGGTVHPLVLATAEGSGWTIGSDEINDDWLTDTWPSPIQLVICQNAEQAVKVGSCGSYTRPGTRTVGQVIRYREAITVRVIIAKTGKVLQSKSFYGSTPTCADQITDPGGAPPWRIYGSDPDDAAIAKYEGAISTQKVK